MLEKVAEIKRRAKALDRSMAQVLRASGVAVSTWQRWTQGAGGGRVQTLERIETALDGMEGKAKKGSKK